VAGEALRVSVTQPICPTGGVGSPQTVLDATEADANEIPADVRSDLDDGAARQGAARGIAEPYLNIENPDRQRTGFHILSVQNLVAESSVWRGLGLDLDFSTAVGLVFHYRCHRDACDAVEGSVGEDGRE
jgi:hypothetical protein